MIGCVTLCIHSICESAPGYFIQGKDPLSLIRAALRPWTDVRDARYGSAMSATADPSQPQVVPKGAFFPFCAPPKGVAPALLPNAASVQPPGVRGAACLVIGTHRHMHHQGGRDARLYGAWVIFNAMPSAVCQLHTYSVIVFMASFIICRYTNLSNEHRWASESKERTIRRTGVLVQLCQAYFPQTF